ncbi:hypothetical protein GOODEAATRI_023243, partial [Goodea atripinnis]
KVSVSIIPQPVNAYLEHASCSCILVFMYRLTLCNNTHPLPSVSAVFSPGTDASDSDFFSDFSDCSSDTLSPSLGYTGSFFPEPEPAAAGLSSTADAILNMITEIVGICTEMEQKQHQQPVPDLGIPPAAAAQQLPAVPASTPVVIKTEFGSSSCSSGCSQSSSPANDAQCPPAVDSLLPLMALEQQMDVADFIESLLSSEAGQAELLGCEVKQEPLELEDWLKGLPVPVTGGDSGNYVISSTPSTLDAHLLSSLLQGAFPMVNISSVHAPGAPKQPRSGRRAHARGGVKPKPFPCSVPGCERRFSRSDELNRHVLRGACVLRCPEGSGVVLAQQLIRPLNCDPAACKGAVRLPEERFLL